MSGAVRTLLLCSRPPWPRQGGDRMRTFDLARALSSLGPVGVVALLPPGERADDIRAGMPFVDSWWLPRARRSTALLRGVAALPTSRSLQLALYDAPAARSAVREAIAELRPDVVVAHLVRTLPWVPAASPPLVVDVQDALVAQYTPAAGRAPGWRGLAAALERRRVGGAEADALRRADVVSYISERDRDLVDPDGRAASVVARAVVEVERLAALDRRPERGVIGFLGNLRTAANRDMVSHFTRRVLPLVRSARPEATLRIFGIEATPDVRALARLPGVSFRGPVEDAAAALATCALTVCPQRFGSGVQNKVLESMAVGTPCVVTPQVADALGPRSRDALAVAELDRPFAMKAVELLAAPEVAQRIAAAGRRFAAEEHTSAAATAELLAAIRGLAGRAG